MKALLVAVITLASVALALGGCGGGGAPSADGRTTPAQAVVVTRDDNTLPAGCRPRAIGERLVAFTHALRTGNVGALREFWGRPFAWFSVESPSRGQGFTARSPADALKHVMSAGGLPVTLTEVDVAFDRSWGYAAVNIAYGGIWGDGRPLQGKGFVLCRAPIIRVWSMAIPPRGNSTGSGSLCPKPPSGSTSSALVACVRGRGGGSGA